MDKNQFPIVIQIPKFIRKVQFSEKQRPRYFEWNGITISATKGKNIPKNFLKDKYAITIHSLIESLKDEYYIGFFHKKFVSKVTRVTSELPDWKKISHNKTDSIRGKWILCKKEGTKYIPVICNPKKVGTPKLYLIKGQDIYSGNLREHERGLVMDKIKENFYPYIKDLQAITSYPVKIKCELHYPIKNPYHNVKNELGHRWDIDNFMFPYTKAFPDLLVREKKLVDDDRLYFPSTINTVFIPCDTNEDRKLVFIISKEEREEIINHPVYKNPETYETEDLELVFGTPGKMTEEDLKETENRFNLKEDGKNNIIF